MSGLCICCNCEAGRDDKLCCGYCCGGLDGVNGEAGCGDYFCSEHLWYSSNEEINGALCAPCLQKAEADEYVLDKEIGWSAP